MSIWSNAFSATRYFATASPEGPAPITAILLTCNELDGGGIEPIISGRNFKCMNELQNRFGSLLSTTLAAEIGQCNLTK
jgi:hypothetical protein